MLSLLAASYGTVSDIELIWTLIAIVGLFFSLHNFKQSHEDLKFLRENGIGNGRVIIARFAMRAEAARALIQMIFITIGISAMFLEEADQGALPLKFIIFGAIFRWGLIISAGLLTYKSYLAYEVRRALIGDRIIEAANTRTDQANLRTYDANRRTDEANQRTEDAKKQTPESVQP